MSLKRLSHKIVAHQFRMSLTAIQQKVLEAGLSRHSSLETHKTPKIHERLLRLGGISGSVLDDLGHSLTTLPCTIRRRIGDG